MKGKSFKQNRPVWFRSFKQVARLRYRRPEFKYLGEKPTDGSLVLSNHEGAAAPLILELYAEFPLRMWGTYEMNSGFKSAYKYLSEVYYHKKKGWNLHLARLFCIVAAPLTYLYYKGLRLIPTYRDLRFLKTIKRSLAVIEGGENIVIYPENSDGGYFKELTEFYAGFALFAEMLYKHGRDVNIFVAYLKKKENVYVFDKPAKFSELKEKCGGREEIAEYLLSRCNELGKGNG